MHGQTRHVHRVSFELAGVDAGAHGYARLGSFAADCLGRRYCRAWSVEHTQGAVASNGHQPTALCLHREPHQAFVVGPHLPVRLVPDTFEQLRGSNDVGEQHGAEISVGAR